MVSTASTMGSLGSPAPTFSLPDTNPAAGEKMVSLSDYTSSSALLIAFICNHCPYVIHIREALVQFAKDYAPRGLALVAISANDADNYPDDSPAKMSEGAIRHGFSFPYLYDEDQSVAKAYRAACTPDFFLFDSKKSPSNSSLVHLKDMRAEYQYLQLSENGYLKKGSKHVHKDTKREGSDTSSIN